MSQTDLDVRCVSTAKNIYWHLEISNYTKNNFEIFIKLYFSEAVIHISS